MYSRKKGTICISCKFWCFCPGTDDYSDVTPGENAEVYCSLPWPNSHWRHAINPDMDVAQYRSDLDTAETCQDFEHYMILYPQRYQPCDHAAPCPDDSDLELYVTTFPGMWVGGAVVLYAKSRGEAEHLVCCAMKHLSDKCIAAAVKNLKAVYGNPGVIYSDDGDY